MTTMSVEPPTAASVDEILRQGVAAFQNEDWPQALAHFDAVARSRPHSAAIHNHRARTYERWGRLEEALECLDRALAIDPNNAADLRNRGIVLRKLGRPAEALACYEALLAIRPGDTDILVKRAGEAEQREVCQ